MKLLGNIFLGLGILLCLSVFLMVPGLAFLVIGALLRIAAAVSERAREDRTLPPGDSGGRGPMGTSMFGR
jgi:hypothetical protein